MEGYHILNSSLSSLICTSRQNGYNSFAELIQKPPIKKLDLLNSPDTILSPIFEIIQSEETTGIITTAALTVLERYLRSVLKKEDIWAEEILSKSLLAVKHCQFEVTDPDNDDAALLKILDLFYYIVECPAGALLSSEKIIDILNSVLRIGRETRRSELLRQVSERSLHRIIELIWNRFLNSEHCDSFNSHEIFEFLCNLSNPGTSFSNSPNSGAFGGKSNSLRILGTSLCNLTLEIFGEHIKRYPLMVNIAKNQLFRILLLNVTSTTNISLLHETLKAFHNLIVILKDHLHGQIELFFHTVYFGYLESKETKFDHQILLLENLIELFSDPNFSSYLFIHYDCNLTSSNLFEILCKFFYKMIKDSDGKLNNTHLLSLQALLSLLSDLSQRCFSNISNKNELVKIVDSGGNSWESNFKQLWEKKMKLTKHAEALRSNPTKGLEILRQSKVLSEETTPAEVAKFLWDFQNWINRNCIGEILRDNDEFNIEVLKEYMRFFDFKNLRIDESLRYMTNFVFLSGEGQQVQRILETFSLSYFEQNPDTHWKTSDNVWLLAVAVIMLHSDLHKPQNINKMSCSDFQINTFQGLIGVEPQDKELEEIYNSVLKSKMETVSFQDTFKSDCTWQELIRQSEDYYNIYFRPKEMKGEINDNHNYFSFTTHNYDMYIFEKLWPNSNGSFRLLLESTNDENYLNHVVHGIKLVSNLAAFFDGNKALDSIVISLCRLTSDLQPKDDQSIKKFYYNSKAQLAAKTMFSITRDHGGSLREGWKNVLELILRIYELDLLPENILFSREDLAFQNIKVNSKPKRDETKKNSGSSHFWSFWGNNSEDSLIEEQLRSKVEECINLCRIPDLLNEAKFLQESSLEYLVKSLIFIAQQQRLDTYSTAFCLDLLTDISISNKHRLDLIFKLVSDFFNQMICAVYEKFKHTANRMMKHEHIILEHTVVASIRLYTGLFQPNDNEEITLKSNIHQLIYNLIIPREVLTYVLRQLCSCLQILVVNHSNKINDIEVWGIIFDQLSHGLKQQESVECCISSVSHVVLSNCVRLPNIIHCVNALMNIHSQEGSNLLFELHNNLVSMYNNSVDQTLWYKSWIYVIGGLNKLCTSIDQNVRMVSFNNLQRIYLSEKLSNLPIEILVGLFTDCHFVLLDELFSPELSNQRNPERFSMWKDSLTKAITLLNRAYLHYLTQLNNQGYVEEVWVGILERMKKSIVPVSLFGETLYEMIKNMFLVMKASGIDLSPNTKLWQLTKSTLNEQVFSDLFIDESVTEISTQETTEPNQINENDESVNNSTYIIPEEGSNIEYLQVISEASNMADATPTESNDELISSKFDSIQDSNQGTTSTIPPE